MSVGGALGGLFNAMIAPQIFTGVAEYPIAIALACFLRPNTKKEGWFDEVLVNTVPWGLVVFAMAFGVLLAASLFDLGGQLVIYGLVVLGLAVVVLGFVSSSQDNRDNDFSNWVRDTGDNIAKSFGRVPPRSYWLLSYGLDIALGLVVFLLTYWIRNSARTNWGWYAGTNNGLISILRFIGFSETGAGEFHRHAISLGLYGPAIIFCIMFGFGRPLRFGLSMIGLMVVALVMTGDSRDVVYAGRSYFGVLRVLEENTREARERDRLVVRGDNDKIEFVDPDIRPKDDKGKDILEATFTYLMHGTTYHGRNYHEPPQLRRVITTYYHQKGPVGVIMDRYRWFGGPHGSFYADARLPVSMIGLGAAPMGVANLPLGQLAAVWTEPPYATIGLGTGTMAGYGRWLQHVTFYEIDDNIRNFSLPPKIKNNGADMINPRFLWRGKDPFFTFVTDAIGRGTNLEIVMGDARQSMFQERPEASAIYTRPKEKGEFYGKIPVPEEGIFSKRDHYYKVIEVDAFSSDAIPIHLITKEAIELYFSKTAPDGVVCVHTSNRHMNLSRSGHRHCRCPSGKEVHGWPRYARQPARDTSIPGTFRVRVRHAGQ